MLYRPLFFTSFLIDDYLGEAGLDEAATVVLASASSKTAFGTAHLLSQRDEVRVVGLTSASNVDFVSGLGCYDQVLTYDDGASLPDGPAMFVDLSGDPAVVQAVHERYGDDLLLSSAVGLTHWERFGQRTAPLPGPPQELFFAPARVEKRRTDWGPGVLEDRLATAWTPFLDLAADRVQIEHVSGPDAVAATWTALVDGRADPSRARILHTH